MDTCHEHNLARPASAGPRPFGIRLSLPKDDPMRGLLGEDWHQFQWFATEAERDARIRELAGPFVYYRRGDRPSFRIEKVTREPGADRAEP